MSALATCGAALVLVVRLQVLFHVVGTGELLLTPKESALDSLLGCVDLRMPRGVTRGREGLLTSVRVTVAARVALSWALR